MSKLAARYAEVNENKKMTNQKALSKASAATPAGKAAVTLPKAPWDKKKESKEAMDPVDKKELKGKHKDRDDTDIDNDGDTDSTDKYLHKRRKAISKKMDEAEDKTTPCPKCEGSMENHAKDCPSAKEAKAKDDTAVMNPSKEKDDVKMEKNESTKWPDPERNLHISYHTAEQIRSTFFYKNTKKILICCPGRRLLDMNM